MCVCYCLRVRVREREKVANLGIERPLRNNKGAVFCWGQDSLKKEKRKGKRNGLMKMKENERELLEG